MGGPSLGYVSAMHVLVALDESEQSWDAAVFAGELLDPEDDVTVVNVISSLDPVRIGAGGLIGFPAVGTASQPDDPRDFLEKLRPAVAAAHADTVLLEEGNVVDRICSVAAEENVDLIITGTRDRGFVKRVLAGSVSAELVERAPCSVLVVR